MTALGAQTWLDWAWIERNTDKIRDLLGEHVQLTVLAVLLGLAVSVPLGVAATRWRRLLTPTLLVTGVLYSIPALALFVLLGPYTGYLTRTTVLIGLVVYTLLILVRNVVAGLDGVPGEVRDAADGMATPRCGGSCGSSSRSPSRRCSPASGSPPCRPSPSSRSGSSTATAGSGS